MCGWQCEVGTVGCLLGLVETMLSQSVMIAIVIFKKWKSAIGTQH